MTPLIEGGWRWHVLADPEGNEFCVLQPPTEHWANTLSVPEGLPGHAAPGGRQQ